MKDIDNLIIRRANIKDLNDILKLSLDHFNKERKEYDKSLDMGWTHTIGRKYFKSKITQKINFVEVAEVNSVIIGYICGGVSMGATYRKRAICAELENMFVVKGFRGKGIGTRLTEGFLRWCNENEITRISVTASIKNIEGIRFYRKIGFKDYDLTLELPTSQ